MKEGDWLVDSFGTKKKIKCVALKNSRPDRHHTFVIKSWEVLNETFGYGYYKRPIVYKHSSQTNSFEMYIRLDKNVVPMVVGVNDHSYDSPFEPSVVGQEIDNFEVMRMVRELQ
jgi:hypothetical protein